MRITDKITQNNLLSNLMFNSERLYKAETQVLTNRRVNKPSDDPIAAMSAMTIRTKLSSLEQYQRNITSSQTMLNVTETAVDEVADIFQRLSTLTVQGASDSYSDLDKQSIAGEVNQLLEQLVSIANSRNTTTYTFAGTNNGISPYQVIRNEAGDIVSVNTTGSGGDINGIIGDGVAIKTNINGEDLFEKGVNLFDIVITVRDNLRNDDTSALSENLGDLNNATDKIYNYQAVIGSRTNRITAANTRVENDIISFTEFLSDAEDVDAAEAIIQYQTELLTLQTSLQVGARLLQPRLIDFLQ